MSDYASLIDLRDYDGHLTFGRVTDTRTMDAPRPLDGIRVVELGQLIAGPFAGSILAYFGAEVVKVEPPGGGDAIRGWRVLRDGTSYFWRMLGRNKKSVTLSLRTEEGRALVKRLIEGADVVIENFRAGAMEGWGLGPEEFRESNPGLVYARVSGYGQTGPYSERPGYASVWRGSAGSATSTASPARRR